MSAALEMSPKDVAKLRRRFEKRVCPEPNTGCFLWTGTIVAPERAYGRLMVKCEFKLATHVAWFLEKGCWPSLMMLHKCDTPACVNVDHLFEGTHADNARDKTQKGRHWAAKVTHCPKGHPYDEANTYWPPGSGYRHRICRACDRARWPAMTRRRVERRNAARKAEAITQ